MSIYIGNVPSGAGNEEVWPHIFKLTRAMKRAGWKVLRSSDGTTLQDTDDPALDQFGAGSLEGTSGAAATIAAPSNGRATVTGLTGMSSSLKGMFLEFSGGDAANNHQHQIERVIDATSVEIDARRAAFTPVAEGSLPWTVLDPTGDTQPFDAADLAWLMMQGPDVIKVPITDTPDAGPTSNFIRGENVTQAVTGAEGEIRGWVHDEGVIGYLVIMPRVFGGGANPGGFADGELITGESSAASVAQDGTAVAYTTQVAIGKDNDFVEGKFYVQSVDKIGEVASDFEALAATATTLPGEAAFPTIGFKLLETGNDWNGTGPLELTGLGQIIAGDILPNPDQSADGSWACFSAGQTKNLGMTGYVCSMVDDGEPGDLDPYIYFTPSSNVSWSGGYATARTNSSNSSTVYGDVFTTENLDASAGIGHSFWKLWISRGGGLDQFGVGELVIPLASQSNLPLFELNAAESFKSVTDLRTPPAFIFTPVSIAATRAGEKCFKGACRHLALVQGGSRLDTYNGGTSLQLSNTPASLVWTDWTASITATVA